MITSKAAVKALREAAERYIKELAFYANVFDNRLADYPEARTASIKRASLLQALTWLDSIELENKQQAIQQGGSKKGS